MKRATTFLRVLLALVPLAVAVAALVLYSISSDMARDYPELAHLQVPVFVGVVIGMAPVVAAVIGVFVFLRAVDRGDAFSATAVRVLGRLKWCVGIFAGYFVAGLVGFWVVTGLMHPSVFIAWFVLEVAALFLLTAAALFERLFAEAFELRTENELTV